MKSSSPVDSVREVSRICRAELPVLDNAFHGDTRISGLWTHQGFDIDAEIQPLEEHVLAAVFFGAGDAMAVFDGQRTSTPVRNGTFCIVPRAQGSYWRMKGDTTTVTIHLSNNRLMSCANQLAEGRSFELLPRVYDEDPKLLGIVKVISEEISEPGAYGPMFIEHALDLLCIQLMRSHSTLAVPVMRKEYGLASWQVRRVVRYMQERVSDDLTLQDLANVVCMSRFHFCTAFRKATGVSPYEYLTRLRIERACHLLLTPGQLPIGEVALAVGYGSYSAFSLAFRRYAGLSPREYRKSR